jgi:alpha/beta superfamily hydrolase
MTLPEQETTLFIPGPAGHLEALVTPLKPDVTPRGAVAVICHPHPLHGGAMQNKVVTTLMRVFRDLGLHTVRFNFRGVGKSEGQYAEGVGETEDLLAVVNWVKTQYPNDQLWLAGFSFGAAISIRAASQLDVSQLVSIAPPVPRLDLLTVPVPHCPWVVVQGEQDEIVVPAEVFAWVDSLNPQPKLIRIPNASHFFHGKLLILRDILEETLK